MTKDENVFLPPIKKISLFTDMIWGLVSGHVDYSCPLNLNFTVKAKSKHSQEYKPTVCAVISAFILDIYMSTAMPSGYVSPLEAVPSLPNIKQLL